MIDEQKRKLLIYTGIGFVVLILVALVAYGLINKDSDLPPVEDSQTQSSSTTETNPADPSTADTAEDNVPTTKDGIVFYGFDKLQEYAITPIRIDVIRLTLAQYAKTSQIESYTFDKASIQETTEGERRIYTFNITTNTDKTYKVELSYVYSTDAFVRILDGDTVVKTSY